MKTKLKYYYVFVKIQYMIMLIFFYCKRKNINLIIVLILINNKKLLFNKEFSFKESLFIFCMIEEIYSSLRSANFSSSVF